jgi:hypothetical protein
LEKGLAYLVKAGAKRAGKRSFEVKNNLISALFMLCVWVLIHPTTIAGFAAGCVGLGRRQRRKFVSENSWMAAQNISYALASITEAQLEVRTNASLRDGKYLESVIEDAKKVSWVVKFLI